jgi:hypothetical protein
MRPEEFLTVAGAVWRGFRPASKIITAGVHVTVIRRR